MKYYCVTFKHIPDGEYTKTFIVKTKGDIRKKVKKEISEDDCSIYELEFRGGVLEVDYV